jgi:ribose transport system permease protein
MFSKAAIQHTAFKYFGLVLVLALMIGLFASLSQNFLRASTMSSIANQIPDLTFIAIGMTLVLINGGIDLSVGSLLALSSATIGVVFVHYEGPMFAAIAVAIVTGSLCGLLNGAISVGCRIPSFIVTLGMLEIARGLTKVATASQSIYIGKPIEWFGEPIEPLPVSPAFLLACTAVIIAQFLLTRTVFGRYTTAIGTNDQAVRMSGIRVWPYRVAVFVISGGLCAIAGVSQTSRLATVDPNAAVGIELAAIAACVIGGTSLKGGRGDVISTFLGVLIISVLQTGLAQLGVSDANKQLITGCVIIAAVVLDSLREGNVLNYWRH